VAFERTAFYLAFYVNCQTRPDVTFCRVTHLIYYTWFAEDGEVAASVAHSLEGNKT
jgi:hypothetical protein